MNWKAKKLEIINKYFTRADPDPEDKLGKEETDDQSDVLRLKSVTASFESDISVHVTVNFNNSEKQEVD